MKWFPLSILFILAISMVNGTIKHIAPVNIPDDKDPSYTISDYRPLEEPVKEIKIEKNIVQYLYDNFMAWLGGFYHA